MPHTDTRTTSVRCTIGGLADAGLRERAARATLPENENSPLFEGRAELISPALPPAFADVSRRRPRRVPGSSTSPLSGTERGRVRHKPETPAL